MPTEIDWVGNDFHKWIATHRDDRPPQIGWHSPSSQKQECRRFKQFQFIGLAKDPPSPRAVVGPGKLYLTARIGTFIHELAEEIFAEHPDIIGIEEGVSDPINRVRGTIDKVMEDAVLDWKSVGFMPDEPRPGDLIQLSWYAYLSGKPKIIVSYISRADGSVKTFELTWQEVQRAWEYSRDEVRAINKDVMDSLISRKSPPSLNWCKSCDFRKSCGDFDKGKEDAIDRVGEAMANTIDTLEKEAPEFMEAYARS